MIPAMVLVAVLVLLQTDLGSSRGSLPSVQQMQRQIAQQKPANAAASTANALLDSEVQDLKEGLDMVEEKARSELGMVKPNEIYVQYLP